MQATIRMRMLTFWKDGFSARERTDGDKGEFPSDGESNDTPSDQTYDSHDNARGSLGSHSASSADHKPSQCNTGNPTDLLRVFTKVRCHSSGLQR